MAEESFREKRIRDITNLYYSRPEIQKAIFDFSKNREISPRYFDGFGKRPDSFQYQGDMFEMVKKGATSFHCSEELWEDPLNVETGMSGKQLNNLRIGWDLLIDIDCKWFDYAKIAARAIINVFNNHGINNLKLKFSGSKGFHIILPWKSIPKKIGDQNSKNLFPELPRKMISYIRFKARDEMIKLLPKDFYEQFKDVKIKKGIKCNTCNEVADTIEITNHLCSKCHRQELRRISELDKQRKKKYKCPDCKIEFEIKGLNKVYECKKCNISSKTKPNNFSQRIEVDLFEVLGLDVILVSPRHLFRMPYSVDFDEPICIKKNKKINIIKIGDFVDKFFEKERKIQTTDILDLNYETVSLNFKNNNARFSKISSVIRHRISENLFSVCLESGRKVKVTSGHSIFILKDGKIKTIKGSKVKVGDYVVVLKKIPENEIELNNINLADELLNIQEEEKKRIFLFNFDESIYNKIYKLKMPNRRKSQIYNWKVCNILPLDAYEILIKRFPSSKKIFKNSRIKMCKHGGAKIGLQNNLKINKELMRLLGYYVSEGYCDYRRPRMNFSFGAHEKILIKDCVKILKNLNLNPRIRKPHNNAIQIEINSAIFNFILTSLFKCGKNANEKRVPSIVWNINANLKKEFLKSYIDGDGHLEKRWAKIIMSTASKRLQEDICFLLSSLDLPYLLSERRPIKWNKANKLQHIVIITGKKSIERLGFTSKSKRIKELLTRRYPLKELGLEKDVLQSRWKNQYISKKVISRSQKFIRALNPKSSIIKLIENDISFLKVKEVKKILPSNKYVYDLSVENDENFVGGNCILLHNSLHEKTALASVVLTPEELENFDLKDADALKAKPRNFMPDCEEGEAKELIREALDWNKENEIKSGTSHEKIKGKYSDFKPIKLMGIVDSQFPPCVNKILKGMVDGRKRALFVLINLFRSIGIDKEDMEKRIIKWNEKNNPPLKQGYITSQLSWAYKRKPMMPQNCREYYQGMGVCVPDQFCNIIKNPVNYVVKKNFLANKNNKKSKKKE